MKAHISIFAVVLGLLTIRAVVAQERALERDERMTEAEAVGDVHHHYYGVGAPVAGMGYGYGYGGGGMYGRAGGLETGIGNRRLSTSEAAENYAQTRHQNQENHNFAVNSYYANREAHDKYVDSLKKGPVSEEERSKYRHAVEPGRLSNTQFDRDTEVIHWPALLRESEFSQQRQALDQLFSNRTPDNSGAASENYAQIRQVCGTMHKELIVKLRKEKLPSVTYLACDHFIKSVAYEGRFAVKK